MVHSLAMDRFDAQFNWKAIMVEPNNRAQSNRWDTNTVSPACLLQPEIGFYCK